MKFSDCHPGRHLRARTESGRAYVRVTARMISTGKVQVEPVVWTPAGWMAQDAPFMVDPADLS